MKTAKKALLLTLCALLVVAGSVLGTLAYLTDRDTVVNTFSVGDVRLTLDETAVHTDGTVNQAITTRVQENEYHLLPGRTYQKDPVLHVDAVSETCYVYVKVENGIALYEAQSEPAANGYRTVAQQIAANGWLPLEGVENVFYQPYEKGQDDKDLEVFAQFKIDGLANAVVRDDGLRWEDVTPDNTKIVVTGYAVQQSGFATAKAAWDATFGKDGGGTGDAGSGDSNADYPADPDYVYTVYFNANGNEYGFLQADFTCPMHDDGEMRNHVTMEPTGTTGIWKACYNWDDDYACDAECPYVFSLESINNTGMIFIDEKLEKGVNVFVAP